MERCDYRMLIFREAQCFLRTSCQRGPDVPDDVLVRCVMRWLAPQVWLEREEWIGLATALLIAARPEIDRGRSAGGRGEQARG